MMDAQSLENELTAIRMKAPAQDKVPQDPKAGKWMRDAGLQTKDFDYLFQTLRAEFDLRDDLDWELGPRISEKLDAYLRTFGKSVRPYDDRDDIMPAIDMDAKPDKDNPLVSTARANKRSQIG